MAPSLSEEKTTTYSDIFYKICNKVMCSPPLQSLSVCLMSLSSPTEGDKLALSSGRDRRLFIYFSPKFTQKASRKGGYRRSGPMGSI